MNFKITDSDIGENYKELDNTLNKIQHSIQYMVLT